MSAKRPATAVSHANSKAPRLAASDNGASPDAEAVEEEEALNSPVPSDSEEDNNDDFLASDEPSDDADDNFDPDQALGVIRDMCASAINRTPVGQLATISVANVIEETTEDEKQGEEEGSAYDSDEQPSDVDSEDLSEVSDGEGFEPEELEQIKADAKAKSEEMERQSNMPRNMDETATTAFNVAMANDEEDDVNERSKLATANRRSNALKAQLSRVCASNSSLREANATLCHAIRQNNLPIPAGCELTAQTLGEQLVAGQTPILAGIAPPAPDNPALADSSPVSELYYMRQLWLPDTSTIMSATKFRLNGKVWPHAIATYQRLRDDLAPIIESDARQILEWQIHDRRDCKKQVTEAVLKDSGCYSNETVMFKLELIYDDQRPGHPEEKVTLGSLNPDKRGAIQTLADPTFLNEGWCVPMENGRVRFVINKLNFKSSTTNPIHRKFRYKLTAQNSSFTFLNTYSPSFWVMAKAWKVVNRGVVAGLLTTANGQ